MKSQNEDALMREFGKLPQHNLRESARERIATELRTNQTERRSRPQFQNWIGSTAAVVAALVILGGGAEIYTKQMATHPGARLTTGQNTENQQTTTSTLKSQFDTPSVPRPSWMKLITPSEIKGMSFAKSPSIGIPDKKSNSLISMLLHSVDKGHIFDAGNVAYPGSTWQITVWLNNGQAIGITPILRGEIRPQKNLSSKGTGGPIPPADYPPKRNEYAIVYLREPATIENGAYWMEDKLGRNQVVFFEDPSLSIQKMVQQLWK